MNNFEFGVIVSFLFAIFMFVLLIFVFVHHTYHLLLKWENEKNDPKTRFKNPSISIEEDGA